MENENKNKIEDFGQKIGGAKKDLAAKKSRILQFKILRTGVSLSVRNI